MHAALYHIKKWLDMKELKGLIAADFTVLRSTSVVPMGHRGWLRLINSHKLDHLVSWLIPQNRLDALKERMGLGYSIIVMGQKKS